MEGGELGVRVAPPLRARESELIWDILEAMPGERGVKAVERVPAAAPWPVRVARGAVGRCTDRRKS